MKRSMIERKSPEQTLRKVAPIRNLKVGTDDGLKEGEFLVYPSTFTKEPDSYGDVVQKGAFLDTIQHWKDSGNVLPGLFGHRMDDPDYYVASAIDMGEDDHGWWVKGEFDLESPKGKQVYRLVKGRRLNQLSFAYDVLDYAVERKEQEEIRVLKKVHVHEFSFVPVGANQDTSVVMVKEAEDTSAGEKPKDDGDDGGDDGDDASLDSLASAMSAAVESAEESLKTLREAVTAFLEASGRIDGEDEASAEPPAKLGSTNEEPKAVSSAENILAELSLREREER